MTDFGSDFAWRLLPDGTWDADFSTVLDNDPIIVVQRFLMSAIANIGDYPWAPRCGTNILTKRGMQFSRNDLVQIQNLVNLQATSDYQIDAATTVATFVAGVLSISTSLVIGGKPFSASIFYTSNGTSFAIGGS